MIKLNKFVQMSDRMRRINSRLVKIVGYKTGVDKQGIPTAVARTYSPREFIIGGRLIKARDQNRYTSSIKFLSKSLNVKVSCSCPDYMFRWEWANAQQGASDIIYGNGEPPDDTNPQYNPGMCKHLLALRKKIKDTHNV